MDGGGRTVTGARPASFGRPTPSRRAALRASAYRAAAIFAVIGALSRFTFRYVETRWQIAAFWALAALYQYVVRPTRGRRGSGTALVLDGVAATVSIVAMKVVIEGHL